MNNKFGFPLIEIILTLAIASVFYTLAFRVYELATGQHLKFQKSHALYFDYNVKKSLAIKMLKTHPGTCLDSNYIFTGSAADSVTLAFPFPQPHCSSLPAQRTLIFYQGLADSTDNHLVGFSYLKEIPNIYSP